MINSGRTSPALHILLTVHAALVFTLGLLLFVSKWFPYGSFLKGMRAWLYRYF